MSDFERELGWEDEIQKDSEFEVLPKGDYDFEVIDFKRGRYDGGPNLPACNKAIISLKLTGKGGAATITQNLFLHSKTEGILCAFFEAIGQRKHGESLKMNWGTVVGSKGSL
ncbi:MAG: DUF669 domain-containing protein, partial [Clostridiales bacterium]